VIAGLRFKRDDNASDVLKNMSKEFSETVVNYEKRNFFRKIFPTTEQKLYASALKRLHRERRRIEYMNASTEEKKQELHNCAGFYARTAITRALESLKAPHYDGNNPPNQADLYMKIKENLSNNNPQYVLADFEKYIWQKKLMEHLKYACDGKDPNKTLGEQIIDQVNDDSTVKKAIIAIVAIIPPTSIFFAPVGEKIFRNTFILGHIMKFSAFCTKPFRWCVSKICIPLEAPFKFFDAFTEALFHSDNFDPAHSFFTRIGTALGIQNFTSSWIFAEPKNYLQEQPIAQNYITNQETFLNTNGQVQPVQQLGVINTGRNRNKASDIKFTMKVQAEKKADEQQRSAIEAEGRRAGL
jgi:hypothetical protein